MIGGAGLLLAGVWLIARGLGVPLLNTAQTWPLVLVWLGLIALAWHTSHADSGRGMLLFGMLLMLGGLFLAVFSLQIGGLMWTEAGRWWPILPLIIGAAFMVVYISGGMNEPPLLVLVYLFGGVGLVALPFTLGAVSGAVTGWLVRLWPLLIVVPILAIVLWLRMNRTRDADGGLQR